MRQALPVSERGLFPAARRVVLASAAALAIAGWGTGVAGAHTAAKPRFYRACHAGRTVFHKGALRAFVVSSKDKFTGGPHERLLLCTSASRKPRVIFDGGGDAVVSPMRFVLKGKRLAVEVQTSVLFGAARGAPIEVGWIDLSGGPSRFGLLNAFVDPQLLILDVPLLPPYRAGFAISPDGSMAVIGAADSGCQVVVVLASHTTRPGAPLGAPSVLYTSPNGGLDPASLTIDETTVRWNSTSGVPASALRSAGVPATGTPSAQTGGC
jgi:hypothetical protein